MISMGLFDWDVQSFFVTLIVLFTSMPVHECAHAFVAHKLGDDTAYHMGRMNLNPFRHLDPIGSLMLLVTQRFGWAKPVPVQPRNFTRKITMRGGMALTSLAGPLSNLLLAFIVLLINKILVFGLLVSQAEIGSMTAIILQILSIMVSLNISLAVFNLLPVPPLDGFNIVSYFIPAKWEYKLAQYQNYIYIGMLVLLMSNLLNRPLGFLTQWVYRGLNFLTGFMDILIKMVL